MYESPRVKLDIRVYLPGDVFNFEVDSLSLFFSRISVNILGDSKLPWAAKETSWTLCVSLV